MSNISFGLYQNGNLELNIVGDFKYVIFFHATSKKSKQYPIPLWVELANYLIKQYNLRIILPFGSNIEKESSLMMEQLINSRNILVPSIRFTYRELFQLINNAEFVFGVDTGLMHLANALNKRLIAIYVDTSPIKTGVFESSIARNFGNINQIPTVVQLINEFETIMKA